MSALGRLWRPWDLKVMNEYGQIVMSVRCDSQSWSEENLLQAFDKAHEAGQLDVSMGCTGCVFCDTEIE